MDMAEFFMRIMFFAALCFVLFFCFAYLFKKTHGKMVLSQLINTVNGDRIDITSWESAIGRAKSCDVVLNYVAVSRFHGVLARRNRGWIIFDTYSKTGIQVNGKRIKKYSYVYDGDMITIGNAVLCFRSPLFKRDKKPHEDSSQKILPDGRVLSALQNMTDGGIILLFSDEYKIGRAASCDIVLPIMTVSRQHAQLANDQKGWLIEDLGSRSGTLVNNRKISTRKRLSDGDRIEVGGAEYKFIEAYMRE